MRMSSVANESSSKQSDEIDLGRLIGELVDHRKFIVTITSIITAITIVYVLLATPIYQSDSLIQIEQKQGNAILSNLSQILPDSQPESAPEVVLLQSRMVLGKTVDDLNLQTNVEEDHFPIIGRGLSRLFGKKENSVSVTRFYLSNVNSEAGKLKLTVIDKDNYMLEGDDFNITGKTGTLLNSDGVSLMVSGINAEPGTTFTLSHLSRLKAIQKLQDSFSVSEQGKGTGILNLTFTDKDPNLVTLILNSISTNYLEQNISRQAAQDAKSLEFLSHQLPEIRTELDTAEDKLNDYRKKKDSVDLTMEAKTVLDQIVNVDNQLNELTFRESEISQLYTKEHPTYKALIEKRQTLLEEKNKLNKKVSAMPATQQEVLRLGRDVESGRAVYMQLLNRQQELNISKSSAIGYVRIVDSAVTEPDPVKPKKILVVLIGVVLGMMLSMGLIVVRIFLRRGIEAPEQLEELGINVYASIPVAEALAKNSSKSSKSKWKKSDDKNTSFLAFDNPADLAIEAIRGLRTSLHFAMMEAKNNILMISGASPNAGKSFVSSNLAAVIAQTGKKVIFIDTDMRKGYAHEVFEVDNNNGLSDALSGKVEIDKCIKRSTKGDFDFISRGAVPPNPAELLMHARFKNILNWASENYDLVVIDTPPILAVTDAAIIGRYVGTTLLVARFEANTVKEIDVSIKRFEHSGVMVKGCILNGVIKKSSSYYGYGYNHYGYSYKDGKND